MSDISFDAAKNDRNISGRGISFAVAREFDWSTALIVEDLRKNYGELRFQALGLIAGRLHVMVFTPRADKVHVISLRKANMREARKYEAQAKFGTSDSGEP